MMSLRHFSLLATFARRPSRTILYNIFSVIIFCSSIDLGIASSAGKDRVNPTPTVSCRTSTEKRDIPEVINSNVLLHIQVSVTVQILSTDRSNSSSSSNLFDPLLLDDSRSYIVTLDEYYDTNDADEGQQMGHVSSRGLLQLEQSLTLPWKKLNDSTLVFWRGSTIVSLLLPLCEGKRAQHTATTRTFVAALWEDTIDQPTPQLLTRRFVNTPSVAREFRNRKSRVGPYMVVSLAGTTSFQAPIDAKPEHETFGVTSKSYCLYEAVVSWSWWFSLVCFGFVSTSVCYERYTTGDQIMNPASGDPQSQTLTQKTTHELPVSEETNNSVEGVRRHPRTQKNARHTMPLVLKVQNDEASDGMIGVSSGRNNFEVCGPVSREKARGEFKGRGPVGKEEAADDDDKHESRGDISMGDDKDESRGGSAVSEKEDEYQDGASVDEGEDAAQVDSSVDKGEKTVSEGGISMDDEDETQEGGSASIHIYEIQIGSSEEEKKDEILTGLPEDKEEDESAMDNDGCDTTGALKRAQMPYADGSSESSDDEESRISRPPIVVRQGPRLPVQHDLSFLARPEGTRSSHSKLAKWRDAEEEEGDDGSLRETQSGTITPSAKIHKNPVPPAGPELVLGGAEEDSVTSPGNDTKTTVSNHEDNKIKTIVPNHKDSSKKQSHRVEHRNDESKEVAPQASSQTWQELPDAATRESQREDYSETSNSNNFKSTKDEQSLVPNASDVSQNEISTGKKCRSILNFAPDERPNKAGADPSNGAYSRVSDETKQPAQPVVDTTSQLAEPANQPVKLNWLRRLRKRGEAHVQHFGSNLKDRQITKQTVIPSAISQRNHQGFSPACSYVSTLPPDSDASQDRPDLGLSKEKRAPPVSKQVKGGILELEGNRQFTDGKPSVESSTVREDETADVRSKLLTSSSSKKRTMQQELLGALPNIAPPVQKGSTKHDDLKEGLANLSPPKAGEHRMTRSMSLSRKRTRGEEEVVIIVEENSFQPPPASSSNRPGKRRRKRRRSIEEPILPDVVPSISLLNAAQNVRDPIWEFRSCAATSKSHNN